MTILVGQAPIDYELQDLLWNFLLGRKSNTTVLVRQALINYELQDLLEEFLPEGKSDMTIVGG